MKKITSRQNPEIISIAKLEDTKQRAQQNRFVAEGLRTCATLLEAGISLIQLYITEENITPVQELVQEEKITLVNKSVMNKISSVTSPSGILGVFKIPSKPSLDKISAGIVLAGITDPGNMGTLIRTCAAMNKKTVVVVGGVDPWNSKVVQASAGTIGLINLFQCSWQELLKHKKKRILAALVVAGGKSIDTINLHDALLVIGSEATGIPAEWLPDCDEKITLVMPGRTESLNAAVAGSIAMYNAWIQ
jgi:TrmH family RNA methyltransferase